MCIFLWALWGIRELKPAPVVSHAPHLSTIVHAMSSSIARVSVPPPNSPFDYFCFESTDASSVILNYVALKGLLQTSTVEQVVQQVAQYVKAHMAKRQTLTFTFHLFCNGMVIREMAQHRVFMLHFARLFRETLAPSGLLSPMTAASSCGTMARSRRLATTRSSWSIVVASGTRSSRQRTVRCQLVPPTAPTM